LARACTRSKSRPYYRRGRGTGELLYQHPKRSARLVEEAFGTDLVRGDELVVFFFDELHVFAIERQLEHRDHVASHELRCSGAAGEALEFLPAAGDVLRGLYDAQAIISALPLHGQRKLLAVLVDADVHLIDFNLRVAIPIVSAFVSAYSLLMLKNIFSRTLLFPIASVLSYAESEPDGTKTRVSSAASGFRTRFLEE